jgi:hypothetical protein
VVSWIVRARITPAHIMDRYELYERCVQAPGELVAFLSALHGRRPTVLREDFAGTAAVSRAWTALSPEHRAEAIDHDAAVLARAGAIERVERVCADVRTAEVRPASVDCVFVGNYSIGEIATRRELVDYFGCARRRLRSDGVFACDTYGGESAFRVGALERRHVGPHGTILHHVWEQRAVDPLTARVENALHFRIEREGEIVEEIRDAFVYRWRLWSVPELVEAALEAGFGNPSIHTRLDPGTLPPPHPATFAALILARRGPAAPLSRP